MGLGELWDALVNAICRPPRDDEYTIEDLKGGTAGRFYLPGHRGYSAKRVDLELVNKRGLKLQCSHYIPENVQGKDGRLPCVIYCHCNSGSRRDCEEGLFHLLPLGVSVFALDFAGSGLSQGDFVTLGAHEVDDVQTAVDYLRSSGTVSTLGLWGRSMGAVTALLYSKRDPSIAGVVLDSPFSNLTDLMLELVQEQDLPIPKALMKMALVLMKRSVRKRAGFDIDEVNPLSMVPQSFIPALFCHAHGDHFIKMHHSQRLFDAYAGDKNFIRVEGDHNSFRPRFFKTSVAIFFTTTLQLEQQLVSGNSEFLEFRRKCGAASDAASQAAALCSAEEDEAKASAGVGVGRTQHPGHGGIPWQLDTVRQASRTAGNATAQVMAETSPPGRPQTGGQDDGDVGPDGMLDDDEAAALLEEQELMTAIQASLTEPQGGQSQQNQPPGSHGHGQQQSHTSSNAGHTNSRSQSGGRHHQHERPSSAQAVNTGLMPRSAEDEEAMLQQALALSLQEAPGNSCSTSNGAAANPPAQPGKKPDGQTNYVDLLASELGQGLSGGTTGK